MKRSFLVLLLCIFISSAYSQQDTIWRRGGLFSINFTQVSLTNWAAGGQNSISGNAIANYFANYKRGKNTWDNSIDLGYGLVMQGKDGDVIKSDDKIDITSKYGRYAFKHWYYTALANFRSQFAPGYNYPNDSIAISRFLAPGYLLFALGMDYKPNNYFSLFISPATARFLIVNDDKLSDIGAFGVEKGDNLKTEVGAFLKASFQKDLIENINLKTTLDLFSDYMGEPQNIDVNWQLMLNFKVNKYISASLSTQLLYDHDTDITTYKSDGVTIDGIGPRTQFKEVLGIGFAYKFSDVKVK